MKLPNEEHQKQMSEDSGRATEIAKGLSVLATEARNLGWISVFRCLDLACDLVSAKTTPSPLKEQMGGYNG